MSVVDLLTAKLHLRVDHDDEDSLISSLLATAEAHVESVTGRTLLKRQHTLSLHTFHVRCDGLILLPLPPLQSVDQIQYVDGNGDTRTLDPSAYQVDAYSTPARLLPAPGEYWPVVRTQFGAVTITYTAGYGDSGDDVPEPIRQAILLLLGHWFENREATGLGTMSPVPIAVDSLLSPYKVRDTRILDFL